MNGRPLPVLPGKLVVKLRPGQARPTVATALDVRHGFAAPERSTGLPAVDRILRRRGDTPAVARVHDAARSRHRPGHRHEGYDDLEHVLGLSRTFRVRLAPDAPVADIARDLRNLHEVEDASTVPLSTAPFGPALALLAPPAPPAATDRSRADVGADRARALEPGDPAVVVAVCDTGIVRDRRWFSERVWRGYDTVQLGRGDLLPGLELLGDTEVADPEPDDEVGHGTACAGILCATGGDGLAPGLAGRCTVLPVRVLGSVRRAGSDLRLGIGSPVDIDEGVKRAVDLGAKVLNCSFGTPLDRVEEGAAVPHTDVVRYALARGCVVVAASGNSGRAEPYTPAVLPGVVTVGAAGTDGRPAPFSTSGPHVDLAAPGQAVWTTGLEGPASVTGTSFAAPFVAATAALLVSRANRRSHPLDGPGVAALLRVSARPWPHPATTGHGAGTLDAEAAIAALDRLLDHGSPAPAGPGSRPQQATHGTTHRRT